MTLPGGGTQTEEADGAVFQILYWKDYENLIFLSDSCNIRCRLGWQKYYLSVATYMDKKTASPSGSCKIRISTTIRRPRRFLPMLR